MEPPFLYKGKKSLKVSADTVFATVKSIIEAGEEEAFLTLCKEEDATLTVPPKVVNLAKRFLFEKRAHRRSAMARSVVDSARCDPPA
jgi:hypothetical protein